MILKRCALSLVCISAAATLTSCGLFGGSKAQPTGAYVGGQEFDPYSNSWKPTQRVVTPPASQPNAELARRAEEQKKQDGLINKTTRAVTSTATAAGAAVKKPLKWVPFVGKKGGDEKDPNYYPAPAPGQ